VEDGGEPRNGQVGAIEERLRRELGADAVGVPAPPPPAPTPGRLGRLRAKLSVRVWRVRAALPESMKKPLRKLLRRPSPAELAEPEAPTEVSRTLEDLQLGQLELTRRLAELEERTDALESRGKKRTGTPPAASK